tara:strand:- start:772 stop:1089 length:318 start_codon:yes stop_codon:yes gene_type:complete
MIKLKDIIFEKKKKGKDKLPPHLEKLIKDLKKKEKDFKKFGIKVTDVVVPGLEWMAEEKLTEGKINQSKVNSSFTKVVAVIRREARKLNDDDAYALTQKLEKWLK